MSKHFVASLWFVMTPVIPDILSKSREVKFLYQIKKLGNWKLTFLSICVIFISFLVHLPNLISFSNKWNYVLISLFYTWSFQTKRIIWNHFWHIYITENSRFNFPFNQNTFWTNSRGQNMTPSITRNDEKLIEVNSNFCEIYRNIYSNHMYLNRRHKLSTIKWFSTVLWHYITSLGFLLKLTLFDLTRWK